MSTAARLRWIESDLQRARETISQQLTRGEITQEQESERYAEVLGKISITFNESLRGDAINVDGELRRRLGPKSTSAVIGVSPAILDGDTRVGVVSIVGAVFGSKSASFAGTLAAGIDAMARILPVD